MENKIIDFNLPEWVDDLTEPFWTENTIRYYEPHFVKPRKTFDEFLGYLVNTLTLEEINPEEVYERNYWTGKLITADKVWLVAEDEKSELYNEFLKAFKPVQFNERLVIFYEEDMDRFNSNCSLLAEWMIMNRGIDQADIDRYTPDYVAYFMAFWGYNEDLRNLNRYLEGQKTGDNVTTEQAG